MHDRREEVRINANKQYIVESISYEDEGMVVIYYTNGQYTMFNVESDGYLSVQGWEGPNA